MSFGITEQLKQLEIRWLIRRDMDEVLHIEKLCFPHPWSEEDFLIALRKSNCIGIVAEIKNRVIGYMIYELQKQRLEITNIAVDPWFQRSGVGRKMIQRLKDKLAPQRRTEITAPVRESNLGAQLFLQACGFRAGEIHRGQYTDTGEDAYLMEWSI